MWSLVTCLPRESATWREVHGDELAWGLTEHLLALAVDRLSVLIWQQTKDGQTGRNQPKPIPRPGVSDDTKRYRTDRDPREVATYLQQFQPKEVDDGR